MSAEQSRAGWLENGTSWRSAGRQQQAAQLMCKMPKMWLAAVCGRLSGARPAQGSCYHLTFIGTTAASLQSAASAPGPAAEIATVTPSCSLMMPESNINWRFLIPTTPCRRGGGGGEKWVVTTATGCWGWGWWWRSTICKYNSSFIQLQYWSPATVATLHTAAPFNQVTEVDCTARASGSVDISGSQWRGAETREDYLLSRERTLLILGVLFFEVLRNWCRTCWLIECVGRPTRRVAAWHHTGTGTGTLTLRCGSRWRATCWAWRGWGGRAGGRHRWRGAARAGRGGTPAAGGRGPRRCPGGRGWGPPWRPLPPPSCHCSSVCGLTTAPSTAAGPGWGGLAKCGSPRCCGWQLLAGPGWACQAVLASGSCSGPGLALDTVLSFTGTRHTLGSRHTRHTLGTRQSSVFWVTVVSLGISLRWGREAGG